MDMLEILTIEQATMLMAILTVLILVVSILAWLFPRRRQQDVPPSVDLYGNREYPRIHATNGVPTMQQLTRGIEMDAKYRGLAQAMYNLGLKQFNRYVNNRDSIIAEARDKMNELSNQLNEAEISLAEEVGIALATVVDDDVPEAQVRLQGLGPEARIYAQSKRHEYEALQTIARDLECGVPRTDFTSIKSRIASGGVPLDAITSELPIMWQEIVTINERAEPVQSTRKPPKREYVHVLFLTKDQGELEDKRAERDGKWLKSHKHGMVVPYQEPAECYGFVRGDRPPVPTGKRIVVIDSDPGTEWETELWRQGGYLDQQYLLHRNGQAPEQLRASYRRRQTRKIAWSIATVLIVVDVVMFITRYI